MNSWTSGGASQGELGPEDPPRRKKRAAARPEGLNRGPLQHAEPCLPLYFFSITT
jgi:hypothetical protein